MIVKTRPQIIRDILRERAGDVEIAYGLFRSYGGPRFRAPGMDTRSRLAWRLHCGRSPVEAAAREYLYRWNLALQSPVFGVPHHFGA